MDFTNDRPITRDRFGAVAQAISDFAEACPASGDTVEWKDCVGPDGTTEKNWPVAYVSGSAVTLGSVVFWVDEDEELDDDADITVKGQADLGGGASLTFEKQGVTRNGDELTVANLVSQGNLPNRVALLEPLTISWEIVSDGESIDAGSSSHTLYVLYDTPAAATIYLSLVDITTRNADGEVLEEDVVAETWSDFSDRVLRRVDLDPISGDIDPAGQQLRYYNEWELEDGFNATHFNCGNGGTLEILRNGVSRCGSWGGFMVDTLGTQGIASQIVTPLGPGVPGNFPATPAGTQYMLISDWTYWLPSGAGAFPYEIEVTRTETRAAAGDPWEISDISFGNQDFDDAQGAAGQGNANPPGWFELGDHALVLYDNEVYDPSYGLGPYDDIGDWADEALDGWAMSDLSVSRMMGYDLTLPPGMNYEPGATPLRRVFKFVFKAG